jgi:OOP family OmpA-OmpF porin
MRNKLITVAAIALTSALSATGVSAHVAGGALTDSSKSPVKGGVDKCVVVADGKFSSKCHTIKPKKVAAPAAPKPTVISKVASLAGDALFATNSAELSSAGKVALDDFAFRASALKVTNIGVVGHADSRGEDAYNLDLSVKRAEAVKAYLGEKGMESSIIYASGLGETAPVASNDTAEGRALNRRVEITVTGFRK